MYSFASGFCVLYYCPAGRFQLLSFERLQRCCLSRSCNMKQESNAEDGNHGNPIQADSGKQACLSCLLPSLGCLFPFLASLPIAIYTPYQFIYHGTESVFCLLIGLIAFGWFKRSSSDNLRLTALFVILGAVIAAVLWWAAWYMIPPLIAATSRPQLL